MKKTNQQMNQDYPCLIVKRNGKEDEYCDLYRAAALLGRSMKSIYECLVAYRGNWRTMAFEVIVESENSRIVRFKNQGHNQ